MGYLVLKDVWARYSRKEDFVLKGINLSVGRGEILALLGPSGCGKTTTLRTIAGFVTPEAGAVFIGGRDVTRLPPNKRNIGIVFQSYALFPHMNVFRNVAYGLVIRRVPSDEVRRRVREVLELVGLTGFEGKYPRELSGGQQQRVALARALAIEPEIMLLDEPMSNIDPVLRGRLRSDLRRILKGLNITAVYVTHDREDAFEISDRIAVMREGRIEQVDTPQSLFSRPRTRFVAEFTGVENLFEVGVASLRRLSSGDALVVVGGDALVLPEGSVGGRVSVGIRPEKLRVVRGRPGSPPYIRGRVVVVSFKGLLYRYVVRTSFGDLVVHSSTSLGVDVGSDVYLTYDPKDLLVFTE